MDNIIQSEVLLWEVILSRQLLEQLLRTPDLQPGSGFARLIPPFDQTCLLALIHADDFEVHQLLNLKLLARRGESPVNFELKLLVPCLLLCELFNFSLEVLGDSASEFLQIFCLFPELLRVLSGADVGVDSAAINRHDLGFVRLGQLSEFELVWWKRLLSFARSAAKHRPNFIVFFFLVLLCESGELHLDGLLQSHMNWHAFEFLLLFDFLEEDHVLAWKFGQTSCFLLAGLWCSHLFQLLGQGHWRLWKIVSAADFAGRLNYSVIRLFSKLGFCAFLSVLL